MSRHRIIIVDTDRTAPMGERSLALLPKHFVKDRSAWRLTSCGLSFSSPSSAPSSNSQIDGLSPLCCCSSFHRNLVPIRGLQLQLRLHSSVCLSPESCYDPWSPAFPLGHFLSRESGSDPSSRLDSCGPICIPRIVSSFYPLYKYQ